MFYSCSGILPTAFSSNRVQVITAVQNFQIGLVIDVQKAAVQSLCTENLVITRSH